MWFQTLKTRHSVRSFSTDNSQGLVAGLEYTDRKTEVHALKVRNSWRFYRIQTKGLVCKETVMLHWRRSEVIFCLKLIKVVIE